MDVCGARSKRSCFRPIARLLSIYPLFNLLVIYNTTDDNNDMKRPISIAVKCRPCNIANHRQGRMHLVRSAIPVSLVFMACCLNVAQCGNLHVSIPSGLVTFLYI